MNLNRRRKQSRPSLASLLRHNIAGAIDLASIMVGVIVLGIIGSVIAATVFAVIPWSQDEAAKATLGSVRTAEAAFYVASNSTSYGDLTQLQAPLTFASGSGAPRQPAASITAAGAPLLPASDQPLTIAANGNGWAAAATSASGNVFYASSLDTVVSTDVPMVLPDGLDPAALTGGRNGPVQVIPASQAVRLHYSTSDAASGPVWQIQVVSQLGSASPYTASAPSPDLTILANPDMSGQWGTSPLLVLQPTNGTLELADRSSYTLMDYSTLQGSFSSDGSSHLDSVLMNIELANYGASVSPWTSTDQAQAALAGAKIVFIQNGQTNTITISPDAVYTNTTT